LRPIRNAIQRTWELSESAAGHLIGVNTTEPRAGGAGDPGRCHRRAARLWPLRQEVRYGEEGSRIDLLLEQGPAEDCYIEVKSVTLLAMRPVPSCR
jgi:sugar fermentation stimulation protein A